MTLMTQITMTTQMKGVNYDADDDDVNNDDNADDEDERKKSSDGIDYDDMGIWAQWRTERLSDENRSRFNVFCKRLRL